MLDSGKDLCDDRRFKQTRTLQKRKSTDSLERSNLNTEESL